MELSELYELTKANFAKLQRQGKVYNYPRKLRRKAIKLLEHYPAQVISQQLGISTKSLRNWQGSETPQTTAPTPATFVALDVADARTPPFESHQQTAIHAPLTLKLPHDLQLVLPEASPSKTAQMICALVKEFSQCSI